MRVTAFMDTAEVGTATAFAEPPGTWPSATLAITTPAGFNNVVIHYDSPPPTGGDWGPIFMADNLVITAVPEPAALGSLALAVACLAVFRTAGRKRMS